MDIQNVGKAITYLRKRAGYTQKDLADRLGVSDKAVSKWERGLGLPDVSLLGRLSILLDTDTDSLLAGDVIHHDKGWHGLLILNENEYGIGPSTVIYDKPLIYYLLSYFLLVGIKTIKIVCNELAESYIRNEFVDGQFEFTLGYCRSIKCAIDDEIFTDCDNFMIVFGRSFIYGVDMTRFFQKAMSNRNHLTVLTLPKGIKNSSSIIRFNENKKIIAADDENVLKTQYNYCDLPICFCPSDVLQSKTSKNINNNISGIFKSKDIYIEALDRGFVEIEINNWDDVEEASSFVKTVQKHCGMIIYCIEEVAWRRGLIKEDVIRNRVKEKNCDYRDYVMKIIEN